jgi:hypothetical protein
VKITLTIPRVIREGDKYVKEKEERDSLDEDLFLEDDWEGNPF